MLSKHIDDVDNLHYLFDCYVKDFKENYIANKKEDCVNKPNHYADTKYECREVAKEIFKDLQGIEAIDTFNIFKYIWRWKKKNGLEDLLKARNYLDDLISEVKKQNKVNI